jgi:hypothetical protein
MNLKGYYHQQEKLKHDNFWENGYSVLPCGIASGINRKQRRCGYGSSNVSYTAFPNGQATGLCCPACKPSIASSFVCRLL